MINFSLEIDVRNQIDKRLENLGWVLDPKNKDRNVYFEQPKTAEEKKKLQGKRPDYVLYEKGKDKPLIVIETKKRGENIEKALNQGIEYASVLNAPIVFATDGLYYKSVHTKSHKPLILNGEEIDELIRELLAIRYLQEDTNEINTLPEKVITSRKELIKIFEDANNILRVEGLRAGIERFSEFSNILFLKLISEIDYIRESEGQKPEFERVHKWNYFKELSEDSIIDYINGVVLNRISRKYNDESIFTKLLIKDGKVFKQIFDKLDTLQLTDINSDIKGDAFEYFLKATSATGNDLGEYFTPRHIVKMMIKLVNPQIGEKIYDPFCGTGGLLIESFKHISQTMYRNDENWLKLKRNTIFGNEITNTARITKMNMILAGDGHSNIQMKNSLANLHDVENKFDIVVTNMPYSQTSEYGSYYDIQTKNGDSICVQHCIKAINSAAPNGRLAIIVPEGFLFRKDLQKTREYLLNKCNLQSVISLPQGVFLPYTGVKTNILYCTNVNSNKEKQEKVWFFDVKNDGFSLDNTRRKLETKSDIDKFLAYRNVGYQDLSESLEVGFTVIDINKIIKNDFILSGNRYKEFIEYSNNLYDYYEIGELITTTSGGTPKRSCNEYYVNGTIPWVKSGEVHSFIYNTEEYINELGLQNSSAKILPENTILIAMYGATAGEVGLLKIKAATNQAVCGLLPNEKYIPEFLYFLLKGISPEIKKLSLGGAQPNLSQEVIRRIKIPLPPKEIQELFVKEMLSFNTIIQNASEIIKNFYVTFPNNNTWEYSELGDVCKFSGGTQPPKNTFKYEPTEGYIRLLQIRDYKSDDNAVYIPIAEKHKTCAKTDVMIGRYGPPVFQILRGKEGAYNVALIKCIPDKKRLSEDWLYYFLNSKPIQDFIISLSERSRQAGVNPQDLNKLKIQLPSLREQEQIVNQIKVEEQLIEGNKILVQLFEKKIQERINQLLGK